MLVIELNSDWTFRCVVGAVVLFVSTSLVDCIAWCGHRGIKYVIREVL